VNKAYGTIALCRSGLHEVVEFGGECSDYVDTHNNVSNNKHRI